MFGRAIVLGLFFALLVSLTFADVPEESSIKHSIVSMVKVEDDDQVFFHIYVFEATEYVAQIDPEYRARAEAHAGDLEGGGTWEEARTGSLEHISGLGGDVVDTEWLHDVPVTVYYYGLQGYRTPVEGCEDIRTIHSSPDLPGPHAICEIPPESYSGACTSFKAEYAGEPGVRLRGSSAPESVCDTEPPVALAEFRETLRHLLEPTSGDSITLFAMFLLGGLLLATMYFSGRSPLTLLDVATPRIPSPKTIAPGGQILAPFGYTEMKAASKKKMKAAIGLFKKERAALAGCVGAAAIAQVNRKANSIKGTTADKFAEDIGQNREFFRSIGLLALKHGIPFDRVAALARHLYKYGPEHHEKLGKLLAELERRIEASGAKRDALLLNTIRDYYLTTAQYQHLEVLTGHPTVTASGIVRSAPIYASQAVIGKTLGHFTLLRPLVAGSHDSLWRAFWQFGRFGKAIGRETKRRAGQLSRAVQKRRTVPLVIEEAQAAAKDASGNLTLGGISPMHHKMGAFYRDLHDEAHRDMARYTISQILQRHRIRLRMTEAELMEMGYKDMDVLAFAGLTSLKGEAKRAFLAVEEQIRAIMSSKDMSHNEKMKALLALAKREGAEIDPNLFATLERLEEIERMGSDETNGHLKMIELMTYLQEEHDINNPSHRATEGFELLVGRDSIPGDKNWELLTLRTYIHDLENGYMSATLENSMKSAYLNVVNRLSSLTPDHADQRALFPEAILRQEEFAKIQERATQYLKDLMTPEGQRAFREMTGKDVRAATTDEIIKYSLYGHKWMDHEHGVSPGFGGYGAMAGREKETGKAHWWGAPDELGPEANWWKVGMKRHWIGEDNRGKDFPILEYAQKRFTKSYLPYFSADIERQLNDAARHDPRMLDPAHRAQAARLIYAKKLLHEDVRELGNSLWAQNAYGHSNSTTAYYSKVAAGLLKGALKDRAIHDEVAMKHLEHFDPSNSEHLRRLGGYLKKYDEPFKEFMKKPVTYDTIAKSDMPWIMTHEGGHAPWVKGMPLSDFDRIYGYAAIKDNKGIYRRFDPDASHVDFGRATITLPDGRIVNMNEAYGTLGSNKDPHDWKQFLDTAKNWAGNDYDKKKVFNWALWHYAQVTDDWKGFWAKSDLTMKPKHEVAPLPPNMVRFIYNRDVPMEKLQKARNVGLEVGHSLSRIYQDAAGDLTKSSWAITPYSEYMREHSWRLAHSIKTADWNEMLRGVPKGQRRAIQQAYQTVANAHPEYHQVWDYAIDRNPWASSTSYGSRQRWASVFHLGPYEQYEMRANYGATMSKAEYAQSEFLRWPMSIARGLSKLYTAPFRSGQEAIQGGVGKWDTRESALKRYEHTQPRIKEALGVFANPLATITGKDVVFKSSAVQRDMAGKRLAAGLKIAPQDINYIRTGVYASARTGESNPGASFYTYDMFLHLDPKMAEYLAYRSPHARYFAADPYVRGQALKTTVKREVASEALALERERELRGFSISTNPTWWAFSPAMAIWHGGPGVLPWWMTPKEVATQGYRRFTQAKTGQGFMAGFQQRARAAYESFRHGGAQYFASRAFKPHHEHLVVYCPNCQTPGYRTGAGGGAGQCRKCRGFLY